MMIVSSSRESRRVIVIDSSSLVFLCAVLASF